MRILIAGKQIATPMKWDKWIREQDRDVRSRIGSGVKTPSQFDLVWDVV